MTGMFDSLRARVAVTVCVVVALGFGLTGIAVQGAAARQARERFDQELRDRISTFVVAAPGDDGSTGPAGQDGRGVRPPPGLLQDGLLPDGLLSDLFEDVAVDGRRFGPVRQAAERTLGRDFFLTINTGRRTATLGDAPSSDPPPSRDAQIEEFVDEEGRRWRMLTRLLPDGRGQVQLGGDVSTFVDGTAGLRRLLILLGSIATLATGLATAWAVRRATRPMAELAAVTRTVAATQDLSTRVPTVDAPEEIREVATSLNAMLERLQHASESQATALHGARRFAADAGHEIRSPLTAIQTTLDALVRNPEAPDEVRREGLAEVASETRRLAGLLASLQLLARVDAGAAEAPERVDLSDVVASAVVAARGRVTDGGERPTILLDEDMDREEVLGLEPWLRSVMDNLLTNAIVHGRPGGTIKVSLDRVGDTARLTVEDDGSGIRPSQRAAVFERFTRGADSTNRPGHGLGLSLVAQLVALHGGTVRIGDSTLGGARVTVDLPAA